MLINRRARTHHQWYSFWNCSIQKGDRFITTSKKQKESREPESNQWPMDVSIAATVHRSANWAIARCSLPHQRRFRVYKTMRRWSKIGFLSFPFRTTAAPLLLSYNPCCFCPHIVLDGCWDSRGWSKINHPKRGCYSIWSSAGEYQQWKMPAPAPASGMLMLWKPCASKRKSPIRWGLWGEVFLKLLFHTRLIYFWFSQTPNGGIP